jgi:hypothetical protein
VGEGTIRTEMVWGGRRRVRVRVRVREPAQGPGTFMISE